MTDARRQASRPCHWYSSPLRMVPEGRPPALAMYEKPTFIEAGDDDAAG